MTLPPSAIEQLARKGAERGIDLQPGLARVEQRLHAHARSDEPLLDEAARYLIDAGGKRFRPMLVLLCGLLAGAQVTDEELVDAGVIVELVHIATLYHDDVIDDADVRRGSPAAHVKWSNTVAILTGDHLLARASALSANLGVEVTRIMAGVIGDLCRGQIREVQGNVGASDAASAVAADRERYLAVIADKTASLIAASCRLGALLGGLPRAAVETSATYGRHLGMSFQLADDVLDITSDASASGKQPGTDLREGVRTMPVLYALDADGPDSELATLLADGDDDAVERALALLRGHPALELARADARVEAAKARRALGALSGCNYPTVVVDGLAELADYAASRVG